MPTIVHNPSGCCFTCDDFETCLDEVSTLNLTISGAPSDSLDDCCEPEPRLYQKMWGNLNGTFQLDQDSPGASTFSWQGAADCDDHQALEDDAVLIEDTKSGTEFGCAAPFHQHQVYLNEIHATITCDFGAGKMKLESVSFACCECSRTWNVQQNDWGPWSCQPKLACDFPCALGEDLQVAEPCTGESMEIEVEWPTIVSGPCSLEVTCDTTQTGSIRASLS